MSKLIGVRGACSAAVLSLTLALGVQVAPAVANTVAEPESVPGGEGGALRSVSCGSKTECVAIGTIGEDQAPPRLLVVRISGGRILPANTSAVLHAYGDAFSDVACPTASECIAVGNDLVTIRNGTPGPLRPIPGNGRAFLYSVSCWTASDCVAVGQGDPDGDGQVSGIVVSIKDGVAQPPVSVPGAGPLQSVECASATCQSTGSPGPGSYPPGAAAAGVVTITNGTPGEPVTVRGASQRGLACPSTTTCFLPGAGDAPYPGTAPDPNASESLKKVITLVNGKPVATRTVTDQPIFITSLACESTTRCVGIGSRGTFDAVSFTDTQAGQWRRYPGRGTYFDATCVGSAGCLAVGGTARAGDSKFNASVGSLGFKLADFTTPKVTGSSVSVGVSCGAPTGKSCAIKGRLTTLVKGRSVVVGTKKVTVKGGGKSTVKVTLNAKGKKLYVRAHRLAVKLKVTSTTGGKTKTVTTRKLTLKR